MKLLIVGGDAAGMSAASRAKRHLPDLEVVVFEKTRDVSYSACGMPYNIADAGRPLEDLVVRTADVFRNQQGIDVRLEHTAEAIDPAEKTLWVRDPSCQRAAFEFDRLLIAAGAAARRPDIAGSDAEGVVVLKNLADGRRIKTFLATRHVRRVAVLGMGYIALEMAEALRSRDIAVDLVKPGPVLLPWLAPELADAVRSVLAKNDVGVWTGHEPVRIETTARSLRVVCTDTAFEADMVLSATGIRPNSDLAAAAGIALGAGGAVAVDRRMQTSHAGIYAAGDCADAFHVVTGQKTWIPLALRANRSGWAAADNICGRPVELEGVAGTAVFKTFDLQVAATGLTAAEAAAAGFEPAAATVKTRSRAHGHPGSSDIWVHMVGDRLSGRLLGVQMVGREGAAHRINAAAVALHARMSVEQFSQTDLAYAPPFGPVWDPMLTAANQLVKKL